MQMIKIVIFLKFWLGFFSENFVLLDCLNLVYKQTNCGLQTFTNFVFLDCLNLVYKQTNCRLQTFTVLLKSRFCVLNFDSFANLLTLFAPLIFLLFFYMP